MSLLRSNICQCSGRGFFTLAGVRVKCPSCRFARTFTDPAQSDRIKELEVQTAKLQRRVQKDKQLKKNHRHANRKLYERIRAMVAAAEAQGVKFDRGNDWKRKEWK